MLENKLEPRERAKDRVQARPTVLTASMHVLYNACYLLRSPMRVAVYTPHSRAMLKAMGRLVSLRR